MYSYDVYKLRSHSYSYILSTLSINKIKIDDFIIDEDYTFYFKSSIYNRHKIKKIFPSIELISSSGFLSFFIKGITNKILVISLIVSIFYYCYLSSFIWKVNINGNNNVINSLLLDELEEHKIKKGNKKISSSNLKIVENNIYEELKEEIEWLEIKNKGCTIYVSYLKRREEMDKTESRGKLYASRSGVIHTINIESGVVKVKENQYVKEGDLLVDNIIELSSGGISEVDVKGSIIATTWYVINIEVENIYKDEVDMYENVLFLARNKLKEKVINIVNVQEENILKLDLDSSIIKLRIHYAVLEDITREE